MNRRTAIKLLAMLPFIWPAVARAVPEPKSYEVRRGQIFVVGGRSVDAVDRLVYEFKKHYSGVNIISSTDEKLIKKCALITGYGGNVLVVVRPLLIQWSDHEATAILFPSEYEIMQLADWVFVVEGWSRTEDAATGQKHATWSCRTLKSRSGIHSPAWTWSTDRWSDSRLKPYENNPIDAG